VPIRPADPGRTSDYARTLAGQTGPEASEADHRRDGQGGTAGADLRDWSQNNTAKTTICVYSLRARPEPRVSTPVTWEEVEHEKSLKLHRARCAGAGRATRRPALPARSTRARACRVDRSRPGPAGIGRKGSATASEASAAPSN